MLLAFGTWATTFLLGYAAALLMPGSPWVNLTLVILTVAAAPILVLIYRAAALGDRDLVGPAVAVAGIAVLFNGLAAIG